MKERIESHVAGCEACQAESPDVAAVASALERGSIGIDPVLLSRRVLDSVAPELARLARRAYRRTVARAIAIALLPLPFVVALDVVLLGALHRGVARVLSEGVATYLVASHAALLTLLVAATYAVIPLVLARTRPGGTA